MQQSRIKRISIALLSTGLSIGLIGCACTDSTTRAGVNAEYTGDVRQLTLDTNIPSDHRIHDEVHAALNRNLPNLNQRIEVNVQNADVYLSGRVSSALHREQAVATAQSVPQVGNVYYQDLSIANIPAQVDYLSDAAIQARLHRAFNRQMPNEAVRVHVDVKNGRVFLTGIVATAADRERAHQIAHSIEGVKKAYYGDLKVANPTM